MLVLQAAAETTGPADYAEVLRVPAMSVGLYRLAAGAHDPQRPHTEDEVYVVLRGRGRLQAASGSAPAVPAGEEHRFVDIEEELEVVVLFAPAEYSLAAPAE